MKLSRAFSLVEVLLAILILALGLLGLGAVIPVVVKQQRTATDRTLGVTAAKDAQADLLSRPQFDPSSLAIPNAWDILLASQPWSRAGNLAIHHLWQPWRDTGDIRLELGTGNLFIYDESVDPSQFAALVIGDRIWPGKSMQTVELQAVGEDRFKPQFVWDIVGRRVKIGDKQPAAVQVALFVRRIDLNIRVPRPTGSTRTSPTLRDVIDGTITNSQDRCVPVAVNSPSDPTPTNRGNSTPGTRTYANFLELDVTYDENYPDRIEFESGSDTYIALASQPNQKLVDNFGNVYTVLRVDEDPPSNATGPVVVVSPAIPQSVPIRNGAPTVDDFRQVVFTPQVPGAVRVFTVTRPIK